MTTELTLREKVEQAISESENMVPFRNRYILDRIIAILDATGAPAYIRVADDLRGVVREEPPKLSDFVTDQYGEPE